MPLAPRCPQAPRRRIRAWFTPNCIDIHQQPEVNYLPRFSPQLIPLDGKCWAFTVQGKSTFSRTWIQFTSGCWWIPTRRQACASHHSTYPWKTWSAPLFTTPKMKAPKLPTLHTLDYDLSMKSQLASTQLTLGSYAVQIWSRNTPGTQPPKVQAPNPPAL